MRTIKNLIIAVLLLSQIACGTLLYPERQEQNSGKLDPTVLILDGIGLFFFIVPGLVAFAVDFSTGAIYLPADSSVSTRQTTTFQKHLTPGALSAESINRIILEQAKISNVLDHKHLSIQQIDPVQFESIFKSDRPALVAFADNLKTSL